LKELDPTKPIELILNYSPKGIHCLINRPEEPNSPSIVRKVSDLSESLQEDYNPLVSRSRDLTLSRSQIIASSIDKSDFEDSFFPITLKDSHPKTLSVRSENSSNFIRLWIPSCGDYLTLSVAKVMNWIKSSRTPTSLLLNPILLDEYRMIEPTESYT